MEYIVGISDMKVSNNMDDILITYSLGSCVGVTVFDPVAGVGGLIHCLLPLSKTDPAKAKANPFMFTDTGIHALLESVFNLGAKRKNIMVKVAGAASPLKVANLFKTGERNYTVTRKVLWKNNILIAAEDVAGTIPRSMFLYMATGKTIIKSMGRVAEL